MSLHRAFVILGLMGVTRKVHPLFGRAGAVPRRQGTLNPDAMLEALWQAVVAIPRGRVSTYGAVALAAGLPGRARLAGRALREAPEGLNLPWHRVLGAGGKVVFPESSAAYREQCRRLRAEGVVVKAGRVGRTVLLQPGEL